MSIENIYNGGKLLFCDNCGSFRKFNSQEECREYMQENGWTRSRTTPDYEWVHYCPDCEMSDWKWK